MAVVEGLGTCLVPKDSGVPCGNQIEQGEPIGTLHLQFGGTVVGHKACVDAYNARTQEKVDDMVKRADQQGPGGPVSNEATDAIMGSIPLEQSPNKHEKPDPWTPDPNEVRWGENVKPVASIPLDSPPPEAQLPGSPEPEFLHDLSTTDETMRVVSQATELVAIFAKHGVLLHPGVLADLILWKRDA